MAITKIISDNEAAIKAAIRSNGQGEITGDLLQEKMLLLNRDLFGGQLDFKTASGSPLWVGGFLDLVRDGRPSRDMKTMLVEWYGGGELPYGYNVYVPLWQAGRPGEKIVAYILLRKGTWHGDDSVEIYPLLDAYGLGVRHLTIRITSSDFDDSPVVDLQYSERGNITMNLPTEEKEYNTKEEMLAGLGINVNDYKALVAGAYRGVINLNDNAIYQIARAESLNFDEDTRLIVGYMTPNVTRIWVVDFASLEIIPLQQ